MPIVGNPRFPPLTSHAPLSGREIHQLIVENHPTHQKNDAKTYLKVRHRRKTHQKELTIYSRASRRNFLRTLLARFWQNIVKFCRDAALRKFLGAARPQIFTKKRKKHAQSVRRKFLGAACPQNFQFFDEKTCKIGPEEIPLSDLSCRTTPTVA